MKIRSALIVALLATALWPVLADAKDNRGGGGGGGGGGRAAMGGGGGHASRAAVRAAPRASVNRSAVRVQSRSVHRAQNRAAVRAHSRGVERAQSRAAIRADRARAMRRQDAADRVERRANRAERRLDRADPRRANIADTRADRRAQARQLQSSRQAQQRARFAARYNANRARYYYGPARWAWRHGWPVNYVGWYGGLFWPFVYSDVFNWAFWPGGYAPGYWYYAYDDFFDGVFYADAGPQRSVRYARRGAPPETSYARAQDLCKQPGDGITAWPIADIDRTVRPNDDQRKLLADLKDASEQAAQKFAVACPAENDLAGTAPGRLATIIGRLKATEEVIVTVKPPLEAFYASLSDEQKRRFDTLGPKDARMANRQSRTTTGSSAQSGDRCGNVNGGLTDLPMQQIELTIQPTQRQQDAFGQLKDATMKAVEHLQSHCPQETASTPASRLDAMHANVRAMIEAAEMIQPALESFYGSLDETQKARLNKLDKKMASVE